MLHEQEPLSCDTSADTYKSLKLQQDNSDSLINKVYQNLVHPAHVYAYRLRTLSWPIVVHSELNSQDIDHLNQFGLITAYCFYHGMISRDWYRHWKHHGDILWEKPYTKRFLFYARAFDGTRTYRNSLKQELCVLQHQVLHPGWHQAQPVDSSYSAKIDVVDAQSTAVHIVAETLFDTQKIYLTEKIFRPMVMKQPFILFAPPGTLATLHRYGFKTFHHIWDESYDSVTDSQSRFDAAMKLIHDLAQLDTATFQHLLRRCHDVVMHNHRRFFSGDFENQMLDEMHHNMQAALIQQKNRHCTDPGGSLFHIYDRLLAKQPLPLEELHRIRLVLDLLQLHDPGRAQALLTQYPWISSQMRAIHATVPFRR